MRLKYTLLLAGSIITSLQLSAQSFLGIVNSNYAGITGLDLQPAVIVDSRYKFDATLFSASTTLANNFVILDGQELFKAPNLNFFDENTSEAELKADEKASVNLNMKVQLLSFMVPLSQKSSIALSFGFKNYLNVDNVSPELAHAALQDVNVPELFNQPLNDATMSIDNMSWMEYGLTYGNTLYEKDKHFVKAAVRGKLVHGISSFYLYANDVDYNFSNDSILNVSASNFNYGHSDNLDDIRFDPGFDSILKTITDFSFASKISPALDFGVVYEFRPEIEEFRRRRPDSTYEYERESNKYKLKIGLSLLDIGRMKFTKSANSGDFEGVANNININTFSPQSVPQFDDSLNNRFNRLGDERDYTVLLPSVFSAQIDYHIARGFYLNFTPFIALNTKRDSEVNRVHEITNYSLTPRFESKWIDVGIPLSINEYGSKNVGLSLRLGPVIVGTNDILPLIGKKNILGADLHAALKIPIPYGNQKDSDGDGVIDKADVCPDVPGLPDLAGCPDTDKDGIADNKDNCPLVAGIATFSGCPDTDNDGIQDSEDDCPQVAGSNMHKGCPDSDGDGLYDNEDNCPEIAGPVDNKGCPYPDSDNDGVRDLDDKCPNVPGPISNDGCPLDDKDGDGIPDKDDKCPNTPGIPELNGCPKLEEKEEAILKVAFENLEFETGKDIIRTTSNTSLNDLANLLISKPSYGLRIAGHTDNVGSDASNMTLSKKRATAVKTYLVTKGVPAEKLVVEYYGETRPIADNKTAEGRQTNRRVEMTVIFE
ncbi:MAG: OmpA family protein [Chitinophagales bacterium]|nr:OmpA family protein [Chitinophagales bacterium]